MGTPPCSSYTRLLLVEAADHPISQLSLWRLHRPAFLFPFLIVDECYRDIAPSIKVAMFHLAEQPIPQALLSRKIAIECSTGARLDKNLKPT
jgi:hypothetical protein